MTIDTKYSVGDKVLVKADPILNVTCPFCKGQGKMNVRGTDLWCQNCGGTGTLQAVAHGKSQLVPGVITGMHLDIRAIQADEDGYEDEDYVPISSSHGICEDYFVDVDERYHGLETYNIRQIFPCKKE